MKREDFELLDFVVVGLLSLISMGPLLMVEFPVGPIIQLSPGELQQMFLPLLALFLLLPLTAAYISVISREGFRWEVLGTALSLPLSYLGMRFAVVSLSLVLGGFLVSYKTRSIFKGDNSGWTYFKATGSLVTVLAVVAGLSVAFTYSASPDLRSDIRSNLTETSVDIALEQVSTLSGGSTGAISGSQEQAVVDLAGRLGRNLSETTLLLLEDRTIETQEFRAAFSSSQQQLIESAFSEARAEIPPRVEQEAETQIQDELQNFQSPDSGVTGDLVKPRVEDLLENYTRPEPPLLAFLFLAVFSTLLLVRFPFRVAGVTYGKVVEKIRRVEDHS